jgi:hypothetical protein
MVVEISVSVGTGRDCYNWCRKTQLEGRWHHSPGLGPELSNVEQAGCLSKHARIHQHLLLTVDVI